MKEKEMEVMLRIERGNDFNLVSRVAEITATKVSEWWDDFVARGRVEESDRRWP